MNYEESVDSLKFCMVERCLADRQVPVEILLHVKTRALLTQVAETLDTTVSQAGDAGTQDATRMLEELMKQGSLLMSVRGQVVSAYSRFSIPASSIPSSVDCEAIYLPPFYLVHTPGLFDGRLVLQEQPEGSESHKGDFADRK